MTPVNQPHPQRSDAKKPPGIFCTEVFSHAGGRQRATRKVWGGLEAVSQSELSIWQHCAEGPEVFDVAHVLAGAGCRDDVGTSGREKTDVKAPDEAFLGFTTEADAGV